MIPILYILTVRILLIYRGRAIEDKVVQQIGDPSSCVAIGGVDCIESIGIESIELIQWIGSIQMD